MCVNNLPRVALDSGEDSASDCVYVLTYLLIPKFLAINRAKKIITE